MKDGDGDGDGDGDARGSGTQPSFTLCWTSTGLVGCTGARRCEPLFAGLK